MPVIKLTQSFVDKLRAPHPSGRQVIYLDTVTKGFGVQVSGTTTAIDYIAQRELPRTVRGAKKQTRRVNIGPTKSSQLRIEVARQRAEELLDQIRRGVDPRTKAEPEPEAEIEEIAVEGDGIILTRPVDSVGGSAMLIVVFNGTVISRLIDEDEARSLVQL